MTPLAIVAAGARTPLGLGAQANALALRAGKTSLLGAPFAGRERDRVVAGIVPTLAFGRSAGERASELSRGVLREVLGALAAQIAQAGAQGGWGRGRVAVLFASSTAGLDGTGAAALDIEAMLHIELGREDRLGPVQILAEGATSAADLVGRAAAILDAREAEIVLWGGAHSDIASGALRALADRDRLFDARHLDAVVPGEGAAVVALVSAARAQGLRRGGHTGALLAGVGGANAEATPHDDHPADGEALTAAVRAAMAHGGAEDPAGWVLSDLGYEALRLREWEVTQLRTRALLGVPYQWDALPQRQGRLGAAHLPFAAAIAASSFALGHVPSASVLAVGGTDAGRRSAVWVRSDGDRPATADRQV